MWGIAHVIPMPGPRFVGVGLKLTSHPPTSQTPSTDSDITPGKSPESRVWSLRRNKMGYNGVPVSTRGLAPWESEGLEKSRRSGVHFEGSLGPAPYFVIDLAQP